MKEFKVEYDLYGSTIDFLKGHYIEYFNTKDEAMYFIKDADLLGEDTQAINVKLYWIKHQIKIDDDKFIEFV